MSNPFKKLGKFIDKNKWQIAAVAAIGVTGGLALTGGLATMSAGGAMALGTGMSMTGTMAAAETAELDAERDRERAEKDYNENTNYFGINRLQKADEADTHFANAMPRATQGSRAMVSAVPTTNSIDDYINNTGSV